MAGVSANAVAVGDLFDTKQGVTGSEEGNRQERKKAVLNEMERRAGGERDNLRKAARRVHRGKDAPRRASRTDFKLPWRFRAHSAVAGIVLIGGFVPLLGAQGRPLAGRASPGKKSSTIWCDRSPRCPSGQATATTRSGCGRRGRRQSMPGLSLHHAGVAMRHGSRAFRGNVARARTSATPVAMSSVANTTEASARAVSITVWSISTPCARPGPCAA
jgi:hypothetical protein